MENKQEAETLSERFERIPKRYELMRFVCTMTGLEFTSEPLTRERMRYRMDRYGVHPSARIAGLVRIEGRTEDGPWITV